MNKADLKVLIESNQELFLKKLKYTQHSSFFHTGKMNCVEYKRR